MSSTLVLAIIGVLLGPGGLVVLWYTNRQRRKDPITQAEAQRAWMNDQLGIVTSSRQIILDDNVRLDKRLDDLEARHNRERDADRERIGGLEARLGVVERLSGTALRYIDALLRYIIEGDQGADVPRPDSELHQHIDPRLHLWDRDDRPPNPYEERA